MDIDSLLSCIASNQLILRIYPVRLLFCLAEDRKGLEGQDT